MQTLVEIVKKYYQKMMCRIYQIVIIVWSIRKPSLIMFIVNFAATIGLLSK